MQFNNPPTTIEIDDNFHRDTLTISMQSHTEQYEYNIELTPEQIGSLILHLADALSNWTAAGGGMAPFISDTTISSTP